MTAAQDGHAGAYQRLLTEVTAWLEHYFRRRLPAGEVDDAVQETLLAIHRRRHTYDPRLPLGPWLAGIARRKWIDQLRSLGRRPLEPLGDALAVDDHERSVTSATVLASLLRRRRRRSSGWSSCTATASRMRRARPACRPRPSR